MATTIDHLGADRRVRILRPFRDADGVLHAPPAEWRIVAIGFDPVGFVASFRVAAVEGESESTVRLDLRRANGPRIGRMREWFEVIAEAEGEGREPPRGAEPPRLRRLTPLAQALLAADIAAAERHVRALAHSPSHAGGALSGLARSLEYAAEAILPRDRPRALWVYERAIECWYGWGALATSGGDGAARLPEIEAALARRRALLGDAG